MSFDQDLLFPEDRPPDPLLREPDVADLAAVLPAGVRLGTSSWTFPGWTSILWSDRVGRSEASLAREGLPEYASSPLLRTVGLDRGFYRPITAVQAEALARQAGSSFRFLVKAYRGLTHLSAPDPRFLDAAYAADVVIAPLLEGLGTTFGTLLFQFPEMRLRDREADRFLGRLDAFLGALPSGPPYAVEVRDRTLLTAELAGVLRDHGVAFGHALHPALPSLETQREALAWDGDELESPAVLRWLLRDGLSYEGAKSRYEPFDRLAEPDLPNRRSVAAWCLVRSAAAREVLVVANNKAEGSAPLTLLELAREIAGMRSASDST